MKKRYDVPLGRTVWEVRVKYQPVILRTEAVDIGCSITAWKIWYTSEAEPNSRFTSRKQAQVHLAKLAMDDTPAEMFEVREHSFAGWRR